MRSFACNECWLGVLKIVPKSVLFLNVQNGQMGHFKTGLLLKLRYHLYVVFGTMKSDLPVKCDFVAIAVANIPVQKIITNVGSGSFQPFDLDRALGNIKVVGAEFAWRVWRLPVEFFENWRPKLLRVFD